MVWLWIAIALIALLFVSLLFWLYQTAFAADKKREAKNEDIPQGEQYIPYAEEISSIFPRTRISQVKPPQVI